MKQVPAPRRRGARIAAVALLFLLLSLMAPPLLPARAKTGAGGATAYQERADAEKSARYRFRRLEWASLVLILAAGGAAIFWVIRRK